MATRFICAVLAVAAVALPSARAPAQITDDPPQAVLDAMLVAVKAASYGDFLAHADDKVRAGFGKKEFQGLCRLLGARLSDRHRVVYLGKLRKNGHVSHLWRLEWADPAEDEVLLTLSVKNGKVSGFFLQ